MELYAKPNISKLEDGTLEIKVQAITLEYVEDHLAKLSVFERIGYDMDGVVRIIQGATSTEQAIDEIVSTYGVDSGEANFLADMTLEDCSTCFNKSACEAEITRWTALKDIIKTDTL